MTQYYDYDRNNGCNRDRDRDRDCCKHKKDYDCPCPPNYNRPRDYGPYPFVVNITDATLENDNFRRALWTGRHLQLTLMSIPVGEDIGLEMHTDVDQFLRIEQGQGIVRMGDTMNSLDFQRNFYDDYAILIPSGKWHNVINTGDVPLKLYSLYAPPNHPPGTVQRTKADAEEAQQ